jgi:threonine/homoserine/homoserine lactone efflux protein
MRTLVEFVLVALVLVVTPGPATATVLRVAARDGRRAATSAILGNSAGVLVWASLSALGISSLVLASELAYDGLRVGGAVVLVLLGVRSLVGRRKAADPAAPEPPRRAAGWRTGLVTSLANPKLALFFVALFPQFIPADAPVLPLALAMAATLVAFELLWYSLLAFAVVRAGNALRPVVQRRIEQGTGALMVALGLRLAREVR